MTSVVPATPELLADLAPLLRPSDRVEVWLSHRHTPEHALEGALDVSQWASCVLDEDEKPVGVFGLGGEPGHIGIPWALASPKIRRADWIRLSGPAILRMKKNAMLLENWVFSGNKTSIRWLKSCGFIVDDPTPYGAFGALFHHFWMKGDLYV